MQHEDPHTAAAARLDSPDLCSKWGDFGFGFPPTLNFEVPLTLSLGAPMQSGCTQL